MKNKKSRTAEEAEVAEEDDYTTMEDEDNKRKKKKSKKKKETLDVSIEMIGEYPDQIAPFVGYFPSGFDPLKAKSEEEDCRRPKPAVKVFRHEKRPNRLQLVVSHNGSAVDFVGTNYSGEAATAQVCSYALGVLDKETQTLRIVPIASNKIFRLEPKIGGSDLTEDEPLPSSVVNEELTAEKKAAQMKNLTLMYSTKKTINRVKKLESLRQKEDPRSKKDLDKKIGELEINKDALESGTYNARNIPPHDMSATTPTMVYPLEKIIFSGEWDYLLDICQLTLAGAEVTPDVYPSFVCKRVKRLEEIEDDSEKNTLGCILSYITHLVKFKDRYSMDGVASAKHHKFPGILLQKFSNMFIDPSSTKLSEEKKDLLVSYILVLTLFVDDFKTDPSDIAKDLRMTSLTLRPHFEHLGCKLSRSGELLLAKLLVPLKFPTLRTKRRR